MKKVFSMLLAIYSSNVFSLTDEDKLINDSHLSISAFQCSVVASDDKEYARLFDLGLKSGRGFIELVKNKPESYKKAHPKLPMIWNMVKGPPSTDFILGQIYSQIEAEIYKKYEINEKLWKAIKDNMYREKNCVLIK